MKKLLYILTCLTLLCSCSAEKRLAHLLEKHPELHRDSVYIVDTFFTSVPDTNSVTFTIEQLQSMLDQAGTVALGDSTNPTSANNSNAPGVFTPISAETSGCLATITPNADGTFNLNAIQKPDTIFIVDSIPTPVYYTAYKDKIVYKMNNAQTFFFGLGILLIVIIAIALVIKIVKLFI